MNKRLVYKELREIGLAGERGEGMRSRLSHDTDRRTKDREEAE